MEKVFFLLLYILDVFTTFYCTKRSSVILKIEEETHKGTFWGFRHKGNTKFNSCSKSKNKFILN